MTFVSSHRFVALCILLCVFAARHQWWFAQKDPQLVTALHCGIDLICNVYCFIPGWTFNCVTHVLTHDLSSPPICVSEIRVCIIVTLQCNCKFAYVPYHQ